LLYVARGDKTESPEKVELLLEHGAPVDAVDSKGKAALHYSAAAGHTRVLTVLLEHGASTTLQDDQGKTALSLARAAGKTAAAALLAKWDANPQ
jgi:ankyrin repeat protein